MGKGRNIWTKFTDGMHMSMEPLPGQSVVEIAGSQRVLIENHFGVKVYSCEKIVAKVQFGYVCVSGCGLELMRMTKEQLVICGSIHQVSLRRKEPGCL